MSDDEFVSSLAGNTWIHSHEEDHDEKCVFRTDGYSFPPSRGRRRFTIEKSGQLIDQSVRSRDGLEETGGAWEIKNGKLSFMRPLQSQPYQVWRLVAIEHDRVVVVRVEPTKFQPDGHDKQKSD